MKNKKFIEGVFEIAFGDNAINKGYKRTEVLERLRYFSDKSHEAEIEEENFDNDTNKKDEDGRKKH